METVLLRSEQLDASTRAQHLRTALRHVELSDSGASSGLGLAIVKRILDLHGSVVRVHSELLRGTRIAFMLPQAV